MLDDPRVRLAGLGLMACLFGLALAVTCDGTPTTTVGTVTHSSKPEDEPGTEARLMHQQCESALVDALAVLADRTDEASEEASVATMPGYASSAESDPEWMSYPRERRQLLAFLVPSDPKLDARDFFRNRQLNPSDTYIPKPARAELQVLCDLMRPCILAFKHEASRCYERGFALCSERGLFRRLEDDVATQMRSFDAENNAYAYSIGVAQRAGFDVIRFGDGNEVFGTTRAELPGCRDVVAMEKFLECSFGLEVVDWFEHVGAIQSHEADAIRRQLLLHADS